MKDIYLFITHISLSLYHNALWDCPVRYQGRHAPSFQRFRVMIVKWYIIIVCIVAGFKS